MSKPFVSKHFADTVFFAVAIASFLFLAYYDSWWPTILLATWISLSARQLLNRRHYDFALTSTILLSLYITEFFHLDYTFVVPVILVTAGIYLVFKEVFYNGHVYRGEEKAEEIEEDIEKI